MKKDEIALQIGEIKGTLKGLDEKFDQRFEDFIKNVNGHFKNVDTIMNDHEKRIRDGENYTNKQKGIVAMIGATSGLIVSFLIWVGKQFLDK